MTDTDTDSDTLPIAGTKSHPYVVAIVLDPAQWHYFERMFEDRPEVRIRKLDHRTADAWTVYVACASQEVRDLLEANW
jgi:hypothetical protein